MSPPTTQNKRLRTYAYDPPRLTYWYMPEQSSPSSLFIKLRDNLPSEMSSTFYSTTTHTLRDPPSTNLFDSKKKKNFYYAARPLDDHGHSARVRREEKKEESGR